MHLVDKGPMLYDAIIFSFNAEIWKVIIIHLIEYSAKILIIF